MQTFIWKFYSSDFFLFFFYISPLYLMSHYKLCFTTFYCLAAFLKLTFWKFFILWKVFLIFYILFCLWSGINNDKLHPAISDVTCVITRSWRYGNTGGCRYCRGYQTECSNITSWESRIVTSVLVVKPGSLKYLQLYICGESGEEGGGRRGL